MVETKTCRWCGEVKALEQFHLARTGAYGRASRCKACLKAWHHNNYLRKIAEDPNFKAWNNNQTRSYYHGMSAEDKAKFLARIRKRRENLPNQALSKNLRRALQRRPTENHVTVHELVEIFNKQGGRCALSGIVMTWAKASYLPTSMSIDRIDCNIGYTRDNVRLICYAINCFRGRWSDEVVLAMAKAIVANIEPQQIIPLTWVA